MTPLPALIAQVQALDEKATPRPWVAMMDEATWEVWIEMPDPTSAAGQMCNASFDPPSNADAPLVAEFRMAAPVLAAALKNALETLGRTADRGCQVIHAGYPTGSTCLDKQAHAADPCARYTDEFRATVLDPAYPCSPCQARSFLERHKEETDKGLSDFTDVAKHGGW